MLILWDFLASAVLVPWFFGGKMADSEKVKASFRSKEMLWHMLWRMDRDRKSFRLGIAMEAEISLSLSWRVCLQSWSWDWKSEISNIHLVKLLMALLVMGLAVVDMVSRHWSYLRNPQFDQAACRKMLIPQLFPPASLRVKRRRASWGSAAWTSTVMAPFNTKNSSFLGRFFSKLQRPIFGVSSNLQTRRFWHDVGLVT